VTDQGIVVLGIPIPSSSPVFLSIVAVHVAAGLVCTVAGIVAMSTSKRSGRHPSAGTVYYWSLAVVFLTLAALSILPMASQHAPLCSRHPVLWRWSGRPNSETTPRARLAHCARDGHGRVVYLAAHGVLRGQRTAPAAVAFAAAPGVLAPAQSCWPSDSDLGADTPSAHSPLSQCSLEGVLLTGKTVSCGPHRHYGWMILASGALGSFMTTSGQTYGRSPVLRCERAAHRGFSGRIGASV